MLCIDWDLSEERLVFHKEGEGAVLPVATLQPRQPGIQVARERRPCSRPPRCQHYP